MSDRDYAPLSIACVRGLCDKIYEKRKFAGVEIEKMVKDFNDANNTNQIKRLIRVLGLDLMSSTNPNVKNGALMGLSSVAVGLGKGSVEYLSDLIQPIVACFSESESRVRYQAAEALFNVLKVAREAALAHFPALFDGLARLAADPEPQVRQAAELLDRLLKDIVTESGRVEGASVVRLVRERLYSRAGGARQFAAGWVAVLDAAPALPLLPHLPDLLDGLFRMLDDPNPEIRRMCDVQLNEFLRSIKKEPSKVDFQAMINILITHAQSPEELLQLTAITWIKEFVELSRGELLPYAAGILSATLPCLAYTDDSRRSIRETAAIVNFQLSKLLVSTPSETEEGAETGDKEKKDAIADGGEAVGGAAGSEATKGGAEESRVSADVASEGGAGEGVAKVAGAGLQLEGVVTVLTQLLHHGSVHTRVAALDWILHLYNKMPAQMFAETSSVFVSVVGSLTDASDDVVRRSLAVLAEICSCSGDLESSPYYYKFLESLLRLLAADENLLEDRGAFIIRQLCVLLNAEEIFVALSRIVRRERDVRLAGRVARELGHILLTAAELHPLRHQLRAFRTQATVELFESLYPCWCHSPVSLLALCFLTHNYTHCNRLISTFGDLEITVDFLTEVDKLVQLIESPIFAYMRLELLGGRHAGSLHGALCGLLMLLPQSEAFHSLRHRLQAATLAHRREPEPETVSDELRAGIDFEALLEEFQRVQEAHRTASLLDRTRADHQAYR